MRRSPNERPSMTSGMTQCLNSAPSMKKAKRTKRSAASAAFESFVITNPRLVKVRLRPVLLVNAVF